MGALVPQRIVDAPVLARLLAARTDWQQTELSRALRWPISRVRDALSQLRRQDDLVGTTMALRADYPLPPFETAWDVRMHNKQALRMEDMRELLALHARSKREALSNADSERLGELILLEQRDAKVRPERIRELRETLELLETLEVAGRGAAAMAEQGDAREIAAERASDGVWAVPGRRAA